MFVYCFIFIILAALAVEYDVKPLQRIIFQLSIITFLLTFFIGLRGISVSRDYETYLGSFKSIMQGGAEGGAGILPLFEPGFVFIVKICYHLFENNGAVAVMLVFALFTISIKIYAIQKLSINPFLVLLLYFSHYFMFQEMTQIRNGLACSFLFLAIIAYLKDEKAKIFFFILLAVLFHNSAVIYLLLLFLKKEHFNIYIYGALLLLSIILGVSKVPFLSMMIGFDFNLISNKLTTYADISQRGYFDNVRFFNVLNTINVIITGYFYFYMVRLKIKDQRFILFLKCNIISIFMYGLLIDVPSMAARFSELFGVLFPCLLAYGIYYFPFKKLNILIIIGIATIFLYINLFYGKLLGPYTFIDFK